MTETLYKVLNTDGSSFHGGTGKWFLPNGKPGKWMPTIKNPEPCVRGYHALKRDMLVRWLGPAIFEVEVDGKGTWLEDKGVFSRARLIRRLENWNDQTARLFACDCAEAVAHLSKDKRGEDAILIVRRYAFGLVGEKELAAARDTAWALTAARTAAWAAARAGAARAAARASQTERLFEYLEGRVDLEEMKGRIVDAQNA